jgi:FAD synthase
LNWLKGVDVKEVKKLQKEKSLIGSRAIASYLRDERFLILPEALEESYNNLGRIINEYENTMKAWDNLIGKLENGSKD